MSKAKLFFASVLFVSLFVARAQTTAFTYQGRLSAAGTAANGQYEMTFTLYDAVTNGNVVGTAQTVAPIAVSNGLFTATLDFGSSAFNGGPRWLEIAVTVFGSDQPVTTLQPRQPVTATPYALHAANAANLMSFINAPLDIKVNGQRALRIEPNNVAANIVGGYSGNFVDNGVRGAVVFGGGSGDFPTNSVGADFSNVSGGSGNRISSGADHSVIAGGLANVLGNDSHYSAILGGFENSVQSFGATIAGGLANDANGSRAFIGGGQENIALGTASTVSGGFRNSAEQDYATVGGGANNSVKAEYATIGGGLNNHIEAGADRSVIGGGNANSIGTNSSGTVIGGGDANKIFSNAGHSAILSGFDNAIGSGTSTIAGGRENGIGEGSGASVIGGGSGNGIGTNSGGSVIGGGIANQVPANSESATIPGGSGNVATKMAFAAGVGALAVHQGAFVWSDSSGSGFSSVATNEFAARAVGGVRFVTAVDIGGAPTAGVTLAAGSGAWSSVSDRNAKENVTAANGREILEKVAALPLTTWNYKSQDKSVRHIGPMAQDFHAAFGVGENDRTISTVDADGVALAAIQGLNEIVKEKDARIAALEKGVADLKQLVAKLAEKR